jgi:hypothetical protein
MAIQYADLSWRKGTAANMKRCPAQMRDAVIRIEKKVPVNPVVKAKRLAVK